MSITTAFAYGYGLEGAVLIGRTRGGQRQRKVGGIEARGSHIRDFCPFFFFSYTVIAAIGHLAGSSIMVEL